MEENILVVAAMKMELPPIKEAIHTGFGKERTKKRIYEVLKDKRPSLVISVGLVGAVIPELKAGDIFLPDRIVDYENPARIYNLDVIEKGRMPILDKMGAVPRFDGLLVTVPKVFNKEDKYELKKLFSSACAVDMETSAIAEAVLPLGIPLVCIKAVSDELDFDFRDKKTLSNNIKVAVKNYTDYLWKKFPQLKK
jgi:nucleoside phosphorylase